MAKCMYRPLVMDETNLCGSLLKTNCIIGVSADPGDFAHNWVTKMTPKAASRPHRAL